MKIELGTLQWTVEIKDGQLAPGSPRLDMLQDNIRELGNSIPDGIYRWTLTMDLDTAERV